MNVLISGGCKNGKSGFAQDIACRLSPEGRRFYVATMIPYDEEDRERIRKHIEDRRDLGFETLETGRDIASCLDKAGENGTFLIDSITALLLNEMYGDFSGGADPEACARCIEGLREITKRTENAVFVTDYIYSDAALYDDFTENYRATLARLDRALAKECDTVIELCAGNVIFHKGRV